MKHELRIMVFALIALFMIHYSLFMTPAYAQTDTIGQSQINPASPLYFLKAVKEIIELKFAATPNTKTLRQIEFTTRRIREIKSLLATTRQDLIEPTVYIYLSEMQNLIGQINFSDRSLASQVIDTASLHMNILQTIYHQVSNPRASMSVRVVVNRLSQWDQQVIDRLDSGAQSSLIAKITISKLSGCNFLSKEASSAALNEVERLVLSERAQKCLTPKPS